MTALPAEHGVSGEWRMDFAGRTPAQMFALAADIESYPRFVPWCVATRILARHPDHWRCDNLFGKGPIRLRFHTRAEFDPAREIRISSHDGPFRAFTLLWRFAETPQGCRVAVAFDMAFRWDLVKLLARVSLPEVEQRIVTAFRARAAHLYGAEA